MGINRFTGSVAAAVGVVVLLGLPGALDAQEREAPAGAAAVTGVVQDRDRGSGVLAASVRLVQQAPDSTFTGAASETATLQGGRFSMSGLAPGVYQLIVRALGYVELEEEIEVTAGTYIQIGLVPDAIELEPILVVTRRSRYLDGVGFYQRREMARPNSMFTYDEIASTAAHQVSDLLRTMPGVTVRSTRMGAPVVLMRGGCRPDMVLDGINLGATALIDDMVRPGDVEGLEVHRGATVPLPFSNSPCGSLVVWTIDPSARERGDPWSWKKLAFVGGLVSVVLILVR
jgi:hypothetical protein